MREIKASEWVKTLTEEQLNATSVVLRDDWGDAIVGPGKLRNLLKNWIRPCDNINPDKTKIVDGSGSVYFGTVVPEKIKARDLYSIFGDKNVYFTQDDFDRLKRGEVIYIPGEKQTYISFKED